MFLTKNRRNCNVLSEPGATPGISAATFRGRRFFLAGPEREAPTGADPTLFPPFVVRWVAIVVEDLQRLARLLLQLLVFDVLLPVL